MSFIVLEICWNAMGIKSIFKIYGMERKFVSETLYVYNFSGPLTEDTTKLFISNMQTYNLMITDHFLKPYYII